MMKGRNRVVRVLKLLFIITLILVCIVDLDEPASSQTVHPIPGPLGYQRRSNRWEGFYEQNVSFNSSSATLEVVSLTRGPLIFRTDRDLPLKLSVDSSAVVLGDSLRIRAVPRHGLPHYRMDATASMKIPFEWPINEVVASYPLKAEDLGVYAWLEGREKPIYVPLSLSQGNTSSSSEQVELTLGTEVDVESVRIRTRFAPGPLSDWKEISSALLKGQVVRIPVQAGSAAVVKMDVRARQAGTLKWLPLFTVDVYLGKVQ